MAQPAAAPKPRGFSRFSKALPAVPQLLRPSSSSQSPSTLTSPASSTTHRHQLPELPKDLPHPPPPPPPPPHKEGVSDHRSAPPPQLPQLLSDRSPPLDLPGAFPPDATLAVPTQKMSIPRRPVAATNGATLSPYPEPSPTASISSLISAYGRTYDSPTTAAYTGAYPATPSASSRETSPPLESPPVVPDKKTSPASPTEQRKLPPRPASKSSLTDKEVPPAPPSKPEIWRRRPNNDAREISGLKLEHSHGSTVSTSASIISTSTTSPQPPSRFSPSYAKDLPPPPPRDPARNARSTTPKLAPAASSPMLTEMPRRKPANTPSPFNGPAPTNNKPALPALRTAASFSTDPSLARAPASEARTPSTESVPSAKSRGSSISPTRPRRDTNEQTPRQQPPPQRPATDSRIVQTERGPMYRGRDGTLYPEMSKLREPNPRAFRFPAWKGHPAATTTTAVEGVYSAREIKESHYSCFQKHATMNRRTNRHYPLTCQTCNKANADDRWACTFCHLRICEPCFRVFDTNQRDLKKLVAEIGRRTPLSLSSGSRPASAFGL
ncbi:hypothetical protein PWT90_10967 [Aphanocladium album]|nr:hypothetical protein PWT90_10967 [Aphanocladium album]